MEVPSGLTTPAVEAFKAKQHVLFALRHAKYLPTPYLSEDSNRMTLAYFCLSALALLPSSAVSTANPALSALEVTLKPAQRQGFVDWAYEQQAPTGGFRGSDSLDVECSQEPTPTTKVENLLPHVPTAPSAACPAGPSRPPSRTSANLDHPNIIQSYTALLILALLADDFSRLDQRALLRFVGDCQNEDGSFSQFPGCPEPGDPRSSYSAFAVASMLDDWSTIDVEQGLQFLQSCRRYEGGFAQRPGLEANAGPTYCAIASFSLCDRLSSIPDPDRLLRWLAQRQVRPPPPAEPSSTDSEEEDEEEEEPVPRDEMAGFQGRANKPTDACYSFWNVAALKLLRPDLLPKLLDPSLDRNWLLSCQNKLYGGIAREPGAPPDVYHTYLSLAALSLGDADAVGLRTLDPAWNVERSVAERIKRSLWRRRRQK
ncbi:hypothetical protein JCM5296_005797 [Sporobolomyces johnsonii]